MSENLVIKKKKKKKKPIKLKRKKKKKIGNHAISIIRAQVITESLNSQANWANFKTSKNPDYNCVTCDHRSSVEDDAVVLRSRAPHHSHQLSGPPIFNPKT